MLINSGRLDEGIEHGDVERDPAGGGPRVELAVDVLERRRLQSDDERRL